MAASSSVHYLIFDVESVADGELVSSIRFPGAGLSPVDAIAWYRRELLEKYESDFIPYSFQLPISICVAKVSADFRLTDLIALDSPKFRSHVMTEQFWRGWEKYGKPTLVSFNGRTFDLPLLELAAFRYGLNLPGWYQSEAKSYDQPRNRYNTQSHLDLLEMLTNFGTTRFTGGLNLAANILGKPGKLDVEGDMVQDYYHQNRIDEIQTYCQCDVLDTYFVFLRSRVLIGKLKRDEERVLVQETKNWIESRANDHPACEKYLKNWGDWHDPWS